MLTLLHLDQQRCLLPTAQRMQSRVQDQSTRLQSAERALSWYTSSLACRMHIADGQYTRLLSRRFSLQYPVHEDIPGKNGASAMPKQNLTATRPPKLVVPAVAADMQDHTQTQNGMYSEGRTLVKIMLLGICIRT